VLVPGTGLVQSHSTGTLPACTIPACTKLSRLWRPRALSLPHRTTPFLVLSFKFVLVLRMMQTAVWRNAIMMRIGGLWMRGGGCHGGGYLCLCLPGHGHHGGAYTLERPGQGKERGNHAETPCQHHTLAQVLLVSLLHPVTALRVWTVLLLAVRIENDSCHQNPELISKRGSRTRAGPARIPSRRTFDCVVMAKKQTHF